MKQTLFFTTLVVFFASDVHGQYQIPYAVNGTVNITLSGCGVTKLCVQTPDSCDPAGNSTCLFASAKIKNLTTNAFTFQLSGNSTGYIGVKLTSTVTQGIFVFACTNSSVYGVYIISGNFTLLNPNTTTTITRAQGQASGNNIQCEFDVVGLNASSSPLKSQDTSFDVQLGNGPLNLDVINFNIVKKFGTLDLLNPAANVATTTSAPSNTTAASNTTAPATASGANRALHSDAVLFLVSVLTLSILKTV